MAYDHEKFWYQIFNKVNFYNSISTIIEYWWQRFFVFLILVFFPTFLSAQSFSEINFQEINKFLNKVQSYRQSYTNYRVQFREYTGHNLLIGELYYAKPQQMRIIYRRGKEVITEVILGSEKLLVYFVKSAIVYEQENFNSYKSIGSLQPGSLDYLMKSYDFNFFEKEPKPVFQGNEFTHFNFTQPPAQLSYHLRLTPKSVTDGLDNLEIWILAEKDGEGQYFPSQMVRSRLFNSKETLSDIYFSRVEVNQRFPADIFSFVIPNHVRIVKNYFPSLEDVDLEANE